MEPFGRCRYCKTQILWWQTRSGKWLPLHPTPRNDGDLEIVDGFLRRVPEADRALPPMYAPARYRCHLEICSQAPSQQAA